MFEPFQYGQQVPAPVVAGKSVHFIDNHGPYAPQQACVVGLDADQHRLERLGRGQQDIGGLGSNALPLRLLGVAVPEGGTSSQPLGVRVDAADEVVEKCFERAEVEHRGAGPLLFCHGRQQGEAGRLSLAARRRCQQYGVLALHERGDRRSLERAKIGPAEGVDDVVQDDGVEPVEYVGPFRLGRAVGIRHHSSSSMSSADTEPPVTVAARLRSTSVSSLLATVSR